MGKAPAVARGFSGLWFNYGGLSVTKNRFEESSILLMGFGLWVFGGLGRLTCDFAE
jgi:hypothetical protein